MKRVLFLIIVVFFLLGNTIYIIKSTYTIPLSAYSITTADIDNDGDIDIITGHNFNNTTQWSGVSRVINDFGHFTLIDSTYFYGTQEGVKAVNLDNNLYPEIIAKHYGVSGQSQSISVIYNNDIENIKYFSLNNTAGIEETVTGLINSDDYLDIVVSSYYEKKWGILYNDCNGNLLEPEYYDVENPPTDIKCGKLNNDEKDDIVVGGGDVSIYLSSDLGLQLTTFDNGSWHLFIDDFDDDGDNDIIGIDGMYTWNYFSYIENMGNGNFVQHPDTTTHPGCLDFYVTDLDNDGLSEIVCVSNSLSGIYIYYNKGNFHLEEPIFIPIEYYGEDSRRIHCDDLDNNGYNDIILVRKHGSPLQSNLIILFNDGDGSFIENPITSISKTESKNNITISCYPNPFKQSTQIKYTLNNESNVQINIYNYSAQLIRTIDQGFKTEGDYHLNFDASGLKKGIYFYSIIINGERGDSKRMVVI